MNVFELEAVLGLNTKEYETGLTSAEGKAESFGSKVSSTFSHALGAAGKIAGVATGAAVAAVGAIGKGAVDSYAQFEQLEGGVKKLFGPETAATVMKNADKAFQTAGMSANEYMETVTGFSASLIKSTGGDTQKAAELADLALADMSDNANTFGSDMESIQNAYSGFSRGNFTMLDNLKLGFAGTKDGMQELLDTAQELTGQEYNIDSYADIVEAIHAVQEAQNIAGTTAKEAMSTIEGSAAATSAAWENVVTALGRGEGMEEAMDGLITAVFGDESGGGLLNNVIPRIQTVMEGVGEFIQTAAPYIAEALPPLLESVLPPLIEAAFTLITELGAALPDLISSLSGVLMGAAQTLFGEVTQQLFGETPGTFEEFIALICESIATNLPTLLSQGMGMVSSIIEGIFSAMPQVISGATQIIFTLLTTLVSSLPQLLSQGAQMIGNVVNGMLTGMPGMLTTMGTGLSQLLAALMQALPGMLSAGIQLLGSVAQGIINNLPAIITAAAQVIAQLLATFVSNLPQLLQQGITLIGQVAAGIIRAIPQVVAAIPQVISGITGAFKGFDWISIGTNIINGIKNGIINAASSLASAAKEAAEKALNGVKNFLGIASPSKVFRDQVGKMMAEGMGIGFEDNVPTEGIQKSLDKMQNSLSVDSLGIPLTAEGTTDSEGRSGLAALLTEYLPKLANLSIYLDGKTLVGGIADEMDATLGMRTAYAGRYN